MLISTWSSTTVALGGSDSTCVASWVNRRAEQGVRIQPVLLCRRLPAQRSKALSCEEQVETARSDWKGKSYADVSLNRVNRFSIYVLHLTTTVYIYIYKITCFNFPPPTESAKSTIFVSRVLSPIVQTTIVFLAPLQLLPRLCPQQFGHPTSRPREYRLTWDKKRYSWSPDSWCLLSFLLQQEMMFIPSCNHGL